MKTSGPFRVARDHERTYPGSSKLATEAVINLLRTGALVGNEIGRVLRRHGLTPATFNVLMILEGAAGALCPSDIGDRLLVTRGTVTGLLDSLERAGLIVREPDPEDRRMLRIAMTAKARALLRKVWVEHFPAEVRLMAGLTKREQDELVKLLGKLQDHLQD